MVSKKEKAFGPRLLLTLKFRLPGTEKQVWPELLDSNVLAGYNCSTPELQLSDPNCPSAGFSTLYQHYSHWWANWETDRVSFELLDSKTRKLAYYIASPNLTVDSWSYMAHMPTAVMQDALQDLHFKSLEYLNNLNETKLGLFRADYLLLAPTKRYEVTTKVPLVRTACGYINNGDPVNLRNMAPVDFLLPTQDSPLWKVRNGSDYETVALKVNVTTAVSSYLGIRRLMSNTSALGFPEIVVIPVEIPEIPGPEKNNTASSAGLVVARRDRSTGDWRAYKCTVDARWASATSVIQSSSESGLRRHRFVDGRVTNLVKTKLLVEDEGRMTHHEWKPPKTGSLRTIRIRPSWYQLLSPVIPSSLVSSKPNSTVTEADRSTLEALLELVVLDDHQHHPVEEGIGATHEQRKMEQIISMVFADGLSRSGATFNSNTSILLGEGAGDWKYPNWRITDKAQAQKLLRPGNPIEVFSLPNELEVEGSTNMTMRAIFNGYVMASRDWFDYMCLGVLILHTFFALSYTLYLAIHGKTSEAWDSIPELVALAQRSQPPPNDKLRNVGAGIQYYQTLKETAWVEVDESVRQAGNSGALRLRIGDVYEDRDPNLVPLPEKKYI
ncbi:Putative protein of unknown function [Podospora comata]|uniref:Uncharacterized protein n=1 Tax=Podospora comata TaxID=48703 RepID=A0ABY6SEL9_PODCO|nr:Putative protein of unknown function [Podospora comata]